MKKHIFLVFLIGTGSIPLNVFAEKACECGSASGGSTTVYSVSGDGCCSSPAVGEGIITYYTSNEGVYEITNFARITGTQAQTRCCTPS